MASLAPSLRDEPRVIRALLSLGWMEFPYEASTNALIHLLGCSRPEATALWKDLRQRGVLDLENRFDAPPGKPLRSWWRWQPGGKR